MRSSLAVSHNTVYVILLWASAGKESSCNVEDLGSIPGWEEGRREKLSTPVFWPGEFQYSGLETA